MIQKKRLAQSKDEGKAKKATGWMGWWIVKEKERKGKERRGEERMADGWRRSLSSCLVLRTPYHYLRYSVLMSTPSPYSVLRIVLLLNEG
jgi:hypothetical protein